MKFRRFRNILRILHHSSFYRLLELSKHFNTCSGKRGPLSLCLLKDFSGTISLENHGELTAHSRCSNYLRETTCGKYIAHDEKLHSQQINLAALTLLQGREDQVQEKKQKEESMRLNIPSSKDIQSESIRNCSSMKKKEELERYQDCSWFQSKSSKEDLNSKLLQAEALNSPDFEVNDLDLDMQFAIKDIPPWGDEYLEVFDDEDLHYELAGKFGEKENHIYSSDDNYTYNNCKLKEDGISDINNYDNCTIKKTDSYDNMKIITSTSLSEIIPISYQEQVNNVNYNIQPFEKIKREMKEESELYSPVSDQYTIDSDECDLNIGREETIEVEIHNDGQGITDEKSISVDMQSSDLKLCETSEDLMKNERKDSKCGTVFGSISTEDMKELKKIASSPQIETKKANLKLELGKNSFDNPLMNLPTPDLDFMDLVHYINNEMLPETVDASPTLPFCQPPLLSDDMPLKESSPNTVVAASTKQVPSQDHASPPGSQTTHSPTTLKTINTEKQCGNYNDSNTINIEEILDSVSIAERIKIGSTRKRSRRFSLKSLQTSEDVENYEDETDKYDNDYTDDEYGGIPRKKKCRSKSGNSDSASSNSFGEFRLETNSYRERRDRNNEASRRSRQNRKNKERLMYKSREEAERKNTMLRAQADKLEKLVTYLRQLLLQVVLKKGTGG